jgi:hypothetical protein
LFGLHRGWIYVTNCFFYEVSEFSVIWAAFYDIGEPNKKIDISKKPHFSGGKNGKI